MRIDVHTHYLPPAFFELMDHYGAGTALDSYAVFGPMLRPGSDRLFAAGPSAVIEDWVGQMDRSAVDLAVVSLGALQPYFANRQVATAAAREANLMLLDAVSRAHGRLAAFASLPLPHGASAVEELRFCLDEAGFAGVNLGTSADGRPLDAPDFDEVWAELDARNATVFIHPGTTPSMGVGAREFHLAPDFCSPTETALALCRLVANRVTTRFPRVQIIAAAMGGSLPFFAHRFDAGMRRSHPDLYEELGGILPQFQRLWYDTSMIEEPFVFDAVRHSFGVDRLLFGSDLPRGPLAEVISFVESSALLSESEKTMILQTNGQHALAASQPAMEGSP